MAQNPILDAFMKKPGVMLRRRQLTSARVVYTTAAGAKARGYNTGIYGAMVARHEYDKAKRAYNRILSAAPRER